MTSTVSLIRSRAEAMSMLEAAHSETGDLHEWSARIAEAANRFLTLPVVTVSIVERAADHYRELVRGGSGVAVYDCLDALPLPVADCLYRLRQVARPIDLARHLPQPEQLQWREFMRQLGMFGGGGMMGYVGRVCFAIFGFTPELNVISTHDRRLLQQVASHVETGLALRFGSAETVAILRPDGRVEFAKPGAAHDAWQATLSHHIRDVEAARAHRGRASSNCIEPWTALVDGRWGLVERIDNDGQRFYIFFDNPGTSSRLRKLTPREVRVLELSARGASNAGVAYALGLSPASVSQALASAALKIGCTNRTELVRAATLLLAPATCHEMEGTLTNAEREVLALVRAGFSNAEIAKARGRSERTVSNQVAALLKKAKVTSRRCLAAWQGDSS